MKTIELTVVFMIMGIDFDKKTGEKISTYQATILQNVDNVSNYVCVKNIKANLHETFLQECKKIAIKELDVKEADIHINDILI